MSGAGLFLLHGNSVTATSGDIDIDNGIFFDGTTGQTKSVVISGPSAITLKTNAGDVLVDGGASIKNGTLNIVSGNDATLGGAIVADTANGVLNVTASNVVKFNDAITTTNGGTVTATGTTVETAAINNGASGTVSLGTTNTTDSVNTGTVINKGTLDINAKAITMSGLDSSAGTTTVAATNALGIDSVIVSGGDVTLSGASVNSDSMTLSGGTTKLASGAIDVDGDISVSNGDMSQGGTTVLTEVPEMFGAETILMNRCANRDLFEQTVRLINDFKQYFLAHGEPVGENPSPGNKAGGISTLEDKALGCTQKCGKSAVRGVLPYGERLQARGLNLLSAPGNDLVASTALAASGCHVVLFTTGRGTPFGTFVPTMKIATNSGLAQRKPTWIDFNAGQLLEGASWQDTFHAFVRKVVAVANGEPTWNERKNYQEIAIFKNGVTL